MPSLRFFSSRKPETAPPTSPAIATPPLLSDNLDKHLRSELDRMGYREYTAEVILSVTSLLALTYEPDLPMTEVTREKMRSVMEKQVRMRLRSLSGCTPTSEVISLFCV